LRGGVYTDPDKRLLFDDGGKKGHRMVLTEGHYGRLANGRVRRGDGPTGQACLRSPQITDGGVRWY
jgi:hypothetical protein